jgi:DNA transformation protein and related proteins
MDSFTEMVLDQLSRVRAVTVRPMFGGFGFHSAGLFFGVVWDGRLYLKTAEADRPAYEERGMGPFTYEGGALKSLWEVPADVLEDADELAVWAGRAITAAQAAKQERPRRHAPRKRRP